MSPAIPPRLWRNSRIAQQLPKLHLSGTAALPRVRRTLCGLLRGLRRLQPWIENTDGLHNIRGCYPRASSTAVARSGVRQKLCTKVVLRIFPNDPPNCPRTSVLLVLELKFFTKIFAQGDSGVPLIRDQEVKADLPRNRRSRWSPFSNLGCTGSVGSL
jgi:hypothetical protein